MAEYYTVLRRAIGGIDPNVPETRRAVYDKARNALIGQLKAVDPPLTTAEISRQRLELEEAIRRVEREEPPVCRPPPHGREPRRRLHHRRHSRRAARAGRARRPPPGHDYDAPPPSPQEVFQRRAGSQNARQRDRPHPPAPVARGPRRPRSAAPRAPAPTSRGEPDRPSGARRRPALRPAGIQPPGSPPPPAEEAYDESDQGRGLTPSRARAGYDQDWQGQAPRTPPTPQVDRRSASP
jgi:hypothetical protein